MAKYIPWGVPQKILSKQRFVDYDLLLDFINTHRFIQFNVKANRDRIRSAYYSLPVVAPFSVCVRFPDDKLYVHLDNGSVDSWLAQLLHALDLPDRAIEKSTGTFMDPADAKRAANVAFNELHNLLCNVEALAANGIYDRSSFEEKFKLTWTAQPASLTSPKHVGSTIQIKFD